MPTRKESVFVVDDDIRILRMMRRTLELEGFRTLTANSGEAFLKMFENEKDISYLHSAAEIFDWLLHYQLDNGSFRALNNPDSEFSYIRGTAKVFEVLAKVFLINKTKEFDGIFNLDYYKACFQKAFNWIARMQYSSRNSYFVSSRNLDKVIGGFRHDYFNCDLWIDGAGHFILGASRFLKIQDNYGRETI